MELIELLAWLVWPVMALVYLVAVMRYCKQTYGSKQTKTIVFTMLWLMPIMAFLYVRDKVREHGKRA